MSAPPSGTEVAPDTTRQALIEAATTVFAEHGFSGGSVRLITRAAGANQAAITYHFGGKDELYRTVLREAIAAFEEHSLINTSNVAELHPEEALRLTMRQFMTPLVAKGRLGRYVQIFGWEGVNPSPVYAEFFIRETPKVFLAVEQLVRRFLPADADAERVSFTAFWLVQQPIAIVRNADRLIKPPYRLNLDPAGIDRLVDLITMMSLRGLSGAG